MELRHLIYFRTVAEELHFTRAANKLYISQPPLSRQIKELEEELGAVLFIRNNKEVTLTDAGKYLKTKTDLILNELDECKNTVRKIHENESGEFRIGYISSVYQSYLAEVLKAMRVVFPYIRTSLYELPTRAQIENLEKGTLDVGILRAPVPSAKLKVKSLFNDPFMLVVPSLAVDTHKREALVEYLRKSPFISFDNEFAPHYNEKLAEVCNRLGFIPDITHEANNVYSILQMIEGGLGVSVLPVSLKHQYTHLKVDFIELPEIPVSTEVVLACHKASESKVLEWFIRNYADPLPAEGTKKKY